MKKGTFNPDSNLYFWAYQDKAHTVELWLSEEEFLKKNERHRIYNKRSYEKRKSKSPEELANSRYRSRQFYYHKKEFKPVSLLYQNTKTNNKKDNKRGRNLEHTLTLEDVFQILENQQYKCYYTGIPLIIKVDTFDPRQASIDRMDSSIGYTKDNVVICCQMINYAKNRYSIQEFKSFFKEIFNSETFKIFINEQGTDTTEV